MSELSEHKKGSRKVLSTVVFYSTGIACCVILDMLFPGGAHFPGMGTLVLILLAIMGFVMAAMHLLLPGESKNKIILVHIMAIFMIILIIGT